MVSEANTALEKPAVYMFGTYWVARSEYAGGSAVRLAVRARRKGLTPREREVALLVERDLSNYEIARKLGITIGTVKNHVHKILLKHGLTLRPRRSSKNAATRERISEAQQRRWQRLRAARSDDNT
jgi:DNA-binding CsgD family transcriptional regulator